MAKDRFVEHSLRTSMYFPASRLFVAGNPKAAGTSMRWWLLRCHGVDVEAVTASSLWGESALYQTVWDGALDLRYTWDRLQPSEQEEALTSDDVLTVLPVRNPVTRAFSAWSGKYLTGEPYYTEHLPRSFPRLPLHLESAEQVAEAFGAFVDALADHVRANAEWDGVDVHFWPQHRLLAREPAGATLLLRQEELVDGLHHIERRLVSRGIPPTPLERLNENVVGYQPSLVPEDAAQRLADLYAGDYATWGYDTALPPGRAGDVDLDWLNDVRGRNVRYGVVHAAATTARRQAVELQQELDGARQREQELLASRSWRVTRPLRWASERLGRH